MQFDLKKLRKDNKLTQQELSAIIGVNRSRLSRIENFKEGLTLEQKGQLKEKIPNYNNYVIADNGDLMKVIEDLKHENESIKIKLEAQNQVLETKEEVILSLKEIVRLYKNAE